MRPAFRFDARAALERLAAARMVTCPACISDDARARPSEPMSQPSRLSQGGPGSTHGLDMNEDELDRFEERAAIIEFEGKLDRDEAERRAAQEITEARSCFRS